MEGDQTSAFGSTRAGLGTPQRDARKSSAAAASGSTIKAPALTGKGHSRLALTPLVGSQLVAASNGLLTGAKALRADYGLS